WLVVCSFFAGPVQASGDERRERSREESEIYGMIEKMPEGGDNGTWIIKGKQVMATDATKIKEEYGRAGVGKHVEVEGVWKDDTIAAYKIEVK
ncbi:MAG: hypothetical protein D3906_17835, partial [Candidatus Electrothrix sp. AUS1_2]|nr:hypothetical protein [Candidatus Electrothrix sp. AUS1_2]